MNILYYCSKFPPQAGGGGIDVYQMGNELSGAGHQVHVVCECGPGSKKTEKFNDNYFIHRVRVPLLKNRGSGLYFMCLNLGIALTGIGLILQKKIDLLHCNDTATGIAALITKLITWKPTVFKFAASMTYEYLNNAKLPGWDPAVGENWVWENAKGVAKILLAIERQFFIRFDRVFSNAKYMIKIVETHIGFKNGKVSLIYNGIDTDKVRKENFTNIKPKLGVNKLIYTGIRFVKQKGVHLLLEACLPMLERWDAHLVIAGDGPEEDKLKKMANNNKRIRFIGNVTWDVNMNYVRSADVFVLPSLVDKTPPCLMEALALEAPCVASNIHGVNELIGDSRGGLLSNPNEPGDIRKNIDWVLSHPAEAQQMGQTGRLYIENNFSLKKKHASVKKLYEELLFAQ